MRFGIYINQKKSLEWGLSASEAMIFAFCYELPSWADSSIIETEVNGTLKQMPYYFASRQKAIEEMPLVTDKPDTIYRIYKSLSAKGLIHYSNQYGKDWICVTTKGKVWNKAEKTTSEINPSVDESPAETSEINPSNLGNKSELPSEINPTDNNTKEDKNTNDEREVTPPAPVSEKLIEFDPITAQAANTSLGAGGEIPKDAPQSELPPEEQRIDDTCKRVYAYLKKYPAMVERCREVAKDPNLTKEQIREEIKAWVRYHGNEFHFLSTIESNISKSFVAWVQKRNQFAPKEKKAAEPEKLVYMRQAKQPLSQTPINNLLASAAQKLTA